MIRDPQTGRFLPQSKLDKSLSDVNWGSALGMNSLTIEGVKAFSKNLSPAEAFQLSIDLKKAVEARCTIARAKLRFFSRNGGREITDGDVIRLFREPAPGWSQYRFLNHLCNYWHLAGERAVSVLESKSDLEGNKTGRPLRVAGLYPLNPFRLYIQEPINANDPSEVNQWRYQWGNGQITLLSPRSLMFETNFNPLSHVRGMSPVLAGVNQVSAGYQAIRYNDQFFQNGAIPSHILVLPKGTSSQDKEAFAAEYLAMHSSYSGGAHKVMVTTGEGLELLPLDQSVKEGAFLNLLNYTSAQLNKLYSVPPVIGGDWDKTKFDSVDIQRETYFEEVQLPDMEQLTQFLQTQCLDRYFTAADVSLSYEHPALSKLAKAQYERAMDENLDSPLVCILDPDTLNIAAKLKRAKVSYAQQLQDTFKVTPQEAAVECGFEFADNDANTVVWHSSTVQPFGQEATEPQKQPLEEATADSRDNEPEPTKKEPTEAEKGLAESYKLFYRELRKLAFEKLDAGRVFRLSEADELAKKLVGDDPVLKTEIRKDHFHFYQEFKRITEPEDRRDIVKSHLNSKNRSYFRALAQGNH